MTPKMVGWILGGSAAALGVLGVAVAVRGRRSGGFGAMSRIGAAVTLFGHQTPKISELRDLITRTVVSDARDEWSPLAIREAISPLVAAYNAALVEAASQKDKPEPEFVSGQKAEDVWREHAVRGFREFFPETPVGDEAVPWWPDLLPEKGDYTRGLVADLAYLVGYSDGNRAKAMSEYARKQMEAEGR